MVVDGWAVVDDVAGSVDEVADPVVVVTSAGGAGCDVSVGSEPRDDTRCSEPPRPQPLATTSAVMSTPNRRARRVGADFATSPE